MSRRAAWLALWLGPAAFAQACEEPAYTADAALHEADASGAAAGRADAGGPRSSDQGAGTTDRDGHDSSPETNRDGTPAVVADRPDASRSVRPEAGGPDTTAAVPDAGPTGVSTSEPVPGALPDWALPLVGTYAVRSVTFSYDDQPSPPLNTRNVEYSLLQIVRHGEELLLTRQMCGYVVSIKGAQGSPPLTFTNAANTPPMQGRIVLDANQTFRTEPLLQHLGFDPTRNTCPAGSTRRTRYEDQTWLTATTCSCYPSLVPEHVDDCRVIDGDADGKPGLTAHGPSPLGTTVADYAMVFDYSVTILDGQVKPNRAHTLRELWAQNPACINAVSDRCNIGNNELCPGSSAVLIPLDDQAGCTSINMGDFGPADSFPAEADCRAKQTR